MSEPIAGAINPSGERIDVAQLDATHVGVLVFDGEVAATARLPADRAVEVALSILLANREALSRVAEQLADEDAAELAVRLMAPGAARAVVRKAAAEGGVH